MNRQEFEEWVAENGTSCIDRHFNGIDYKFVTLEDNWIAIFEVDAGYFHPKIEAADMSHAESWCNMREAVRVPFNVF